VTALFRDKQGDLWIGTEKQGLFHISHGMSDHYGSAEGLSGDSIVKIFQDREGSV
jgi:ligand-binding sensor domain-containing protein